MIKIDGKYKTRTGFPVVIYSVDRGGKFPVHGAIQFDGDWIPSRWTAHGAENIYSSSDRDLLEEAEPDFKWLNIYQTGLGSWYPSREGADSAALTANGKLIGVIRVEILDNAFEVIREKL